MASTLGNTTVTTANLSDGTNTTSTTNCIRGSAKAWVNFNGASGAVNGSFNVGSVTKNGTSDFTVNFTNALADTNYVVQRTLTGTANYGQYNEASSTNNAFVLSTSSVRLGGARDSNGGLRDCTAIYVTINR